MIFKKTRQVILTAFVVCVIVVAGAVTAMAASGNTTITASNVQATSGTQVQMEVAIANNPGVLGMTLEVSYPSELTLTGASAGDAFPGLTLTKPGKYASPCNFVWDGQEIDPAEVKDGVILTLLFDVSDEAQPGSDLDVALRVRDGDAVDDDLNPIQITTVTGSVRISGSDAPSVYAIAVSPAANGIVTVNKSTAKDGEIVKVTANPANGYELDKITYTTADGDVIDITTNRNYDGAYSFTMPDSPVTLAASFKAVAHVCPSARFIDVVDPWYHEYIDYVVENNLMQGISDDHFAPNSPLTRAMIVTILYRLENMPAVSEASPFEDIPIGQWYSDAVIWANSKGIVEGYGNGKFGQMDMITREQFAAIMYRYSQYKGYDVSSLADLSRYIDASSISFWALTAMKWANAESLITGRTATTLEPGGNTTRAEAAAIFMRFIKNK